MAVVDHALLWGNVRANQETAAAWALWQDNQKWGWPGLGLAAWSVPAVGSIDWGANPYGNQSWFMYFHGLVFLEAISYGLNNGASAATYKPLLTNYIMSWIAGNTQAGRPLAWTEETIPRRAQVISYIYHRHLRGTAYITAGQEATLLASMEEHANALSALIDNPEYADDNHGWMHRLGLYNTCVAFPEIANSATLRAKARQGMIDSMPLLFVYPSGAVVEQANGYHYVNLTFVEEGVTLCANFSEPITGDPVAAERLTASVKWGALTCLPNDKIPGCGDTAVGSAYSSSIINTLRGKGFDSPEAQYAALKGGGGSRPAKAYFWPDSGYALIRPDWTPGAWANDFVLFVACWLAKVSHGHKHTGGNFVLYSHGVNLIEDSGGPYVYGDSAAQRYFIEPESHNQIVVNGATYSDTSATIVSSGSNDTASWLTLQHTGFAGSTVRRTIAVDHVGRNVVVIDDVTCNQQRDIDLLWHLPVASTLSTDGTRRVSVVGTGKLGVDVADLSADVVQGVEDASGNAVQGWISSGYLQRSAAPVLKYRKTGTSARFVTVLQAASASSALLPVSISQTAGDVVATIGGAAVIISPTAAAVVRKETAIMAKYRRITPDTQEVEKFATTMSGPVNCTQSAEPAADTLTGDAVRMTVNAGQNAAYFDRSLGTGPDMSAGGQVVIIANILDDVGATSKLGCDLSNTTLSTGNLSFLAPGVKKGFNVLRKRTGSAVGWTNYAAGVGTWGNIKYMRFRASNLPGARIVWEHAYYGGFHRPCIMIGLDGGFTSQATRGINALSTAGVEGVYFAPTPENIGQASYASAAAIAAIAADGVEILGSVGTDVATAKALADQYKGSGVVWASAPTDAKIIAAGTAKWGSYNGAAENFLCGFGNLNPLRHNSYALGGVALATAKARVDATLSSGELLIFSVPALVTGGTGGAAPVDTTTWYAEDLAALAQYIAGYVRQGRCESKTPAAWLKSVA